MAAPGTLISFSAGTVIRSADVNANFSSLRNSALTALYTDTAKTVTVTNVWTVSQTFQGGIGVSGTATFASGLQITGGTVNVSGITVSGAVTFSSAVTVSGPITASSTATFAGNVTMAAALNVALAITCSSLSVSNAFTASSFVATTTMTASSITATNSITAANFIAATGSAATPSVAVGSAGSGTGLYSDASNDFRAAIGGTQVFDSALAPNVFSVVNFKFKIASQSGIVCASGALATSATVGFVYVPTTPGTITSTAATETGTVALCYDTTNNRLQVYNGAWKTVALA